MFIPVSLAFAFGISSILSRYLEWKPCEVPEFLPALNPNGGGKILKFDRVWELAIAIDYKYPRRGRTSWLRLLKILDNTIVVGGECPESRNYGVKPRGVR
jgi:hypothetical protein